MNDTCSYFDNLINEYIDGEIDKKEKTTLEAHLQQCKVCSKNLKETELTVKTIRSLKNIEAPEAKEGFSAEIIKQLEKEQKPNNILTFKTMKYVAAAILTIGLISIFIINNPDKIITISNTDNNNLNEEYTEDFTSLFYESDSSILADAGFPTDEWGLLDLDNM